MDGRTRKFALHLAITGKYDKLFTLATARVGSTLNFPRIGPFSETVTFWLVPRNIYGEEKSFG